MFFDIPEFKIRSLLTRAEANYDLLFDTDQWHIARATVDAGEKELPPLTTHRSGRTSDYTFETFGIELRY